MLLDYWLDCWRRCNLKEVAGIEKDPTQVSLSPVQVNRLRVRGNYVCFPAIIVIVMGLSGLKSSYRGKLKGWATKSKEITFSGEIDPSDILSELPTYFSFFWSKKSYMICPTKYSFLLKPLKYLVAWEKLKFVSVFFLGSSFTFNFLSICKRQLNENLLFLTLYYAIILFCLMYSLNIPHSTQNPYFQDSHFGDISP